MNRYTFVTVAHSVDLPLLKLQARSLNRYLDRSFVREVIVVDNSTNGNELSREQLLPQYGNLPVRIIRAAEITTMPPMAGWFSQQILKLMVARHVRTQYYVILDAKNHLIEPVNRSTFEAKDGRLRTGCHSYAKHTLRRYLWAACRYFSVPQEKVIHRFLPTTPPFTIITRLAKKMIDYVERRDRQPFPAAFYHQGLTEFFSYGVFLVWMGHKIETLYCFDNWMGGCLWKEQTDAHMQRTIANPPSVCFAVHRRTFSRMDATTQEAVAKFWHERRLFIGYADALRFIKGCAITYG